MRAAKAILLSAMAMAAVVAGRGRAEACSFQSGVQSRVVAPADQAQGVPINSLVRIVYKHSPDTSTQLIPTLPDIKLRPMGGAPIDATVTAGVGGNKFRSVFVLKPTAMLQPGTTYEVLTKVKASFCSSDCIEADYVVASQFTAGTMLDPHAPQFAGLQAIEVGEPRLTADNDSCGKSDWVGFKMRWTSATDEGPIFYDVYRTGSTTPVISGLTVHEIDGAVRCALNRTTTTGSFSAEPGSYFVRALDQAGNPDVNNVNVTLGALCDTCGPDQGFCEPGNGCQIGAGAAPGGAPAALAVFGLGLMIAVRSRRRRRA